MNYLVDKKGCDGSESKKNMYLQKFPSQQRKDIIFQIFEGFEP